MYVLVPFVDFDFLQDQALGLGHRLYEEAAMAITGAWLLYARSSRERLGT